MTQEEYMEYLDNKLDTPKEDKKIKKIDEREALDKIFTYEKSSNLYFLSLYVQNDIVNKLNEIIDKINGEDND